MNFYQKFFFNPRRHESRIEERFESGQFTEYHTQQSWIWPKWAFTNYVTQLGGGGLTIV